VCVGGGRERKKKKEEEGRRRRIFNMSLFSRILELGSHIDKQFQDEICQYILDGINLLL
jgi:hypothetical protein